MNNPYCIGFNYGDKNLKLFPMKCNLGKLGPQSTFQAVQ